MANEEGGPTRFVVVGGQRCGSTYLHHLLESHPDVAMARPANPEPKVFTSEELTARGREWYDATFFPHATTEAAWGEKSTSYLEDAAAPERAARVLGRPTVLAVLRDPVARAVSNWRFSSEKGRETRSVEKALSAALAGVDPWDGTGSTSSPFDYLRRGRYAELLQPWLDVFPEDVRIFLLDDLLDGRAVPDLYRAVGVDPADAPPPPARPVNASGSADPVLPAALERDLREYYRPHDEALAALLGREPAWLRATTRERP
jgi:hypothetical protein